MKSVIVTGGSGKAGGAAIRELLEHGYQVLNVDTAAPAEQLCHFMKTDLNDLGQAVDALLAAGTIDRRRASIGEPSAVIHLAGAARADRSFSLHPAPPAVRPWRCHPWCWR
jgi:nucleoside-diphosphate-sugar epimerase